MEPQLGLDGLCESQQALPQAGTDGEAQTPAESQ